jgi:hypothetical protein
MYASGPLPHGVRSGRGRNRITWDQPRARYELAGFGSMRAGFRNDIDFQRFSRRVGFFCAKNANLFITELREWNLPTHIEVLLSFIVEVLHLCHF